MQLHPTFIKIIQMSKPFASHDNESERFLTRRLLLLKVRNL